MLDCKIYALAVWQESMFGPFLPVREIVFLRRMRLATSKSGLILQLTGPGILPSGCIATKQFPLLWSKEVLCFE